MSDQTFGKAAREYWDKLEARSQWREITAEQYRLGNDPVGYDEVYIVLPETGTRHEVWDVGIDLDEQGNVHIYTAAADPVVVPKDHPIEVR